MVPKAGDAVLHWALDEPVALILKGDALIAQATESGRSRVLREKGVISALHDASLDLVWIQGTTTLDVLDLRAPSGEPVPIATGLPEGKRIQIERDVGGKHVHLAAPDVCVQASDLFLDWTPEPRLQFISGDKDEEQRAMESAKLIGARFLREQLTRVPGAGSVARRDFTLAPKGPLPPPRLACESIDLCGTAIPFDTQGRLLLLTDHSEGDCQHYGCRLYDPAAKKFASPPLGERWGELDKVPSGACGLYRFDRSGSVSSWATRPVLSEAHATSSAEWR